MLDYSDTKREHEQWFNRSAKNATKASQDVSELESDFSESEEDESDFDDPGFVIKSLIRRRAPSPVTPTPEGLLEEDVDDYAVYFVYYSNYQYGVLVD
ncbi:hypothetical protein N7501_002322 [Penicillium viridicatum]|nr:hypothetical protein N7501_002322 [Penicillium viridicatum]